MNLTKTAALKIARSAVSMPFGSGTSWSINHPYRHATLDDLSGPGTSRNATSYSAAMAMRATTVADITLSLMGINSDDAQYAIHNPQPADRTISGLVEAGIAASH